MIFKYIIFYNLKLYILIVWYEGNEFEDNNSNLVNSSNSRASLDIDDFEFVRDPVIILFFLNHYYEIMLLNFIFLLK